MKKCASQLYKKINIRAELVYKIYKKGRNTPKRLKPLENATEQSHYTADLISRSKRHTRFYGKYLINEKVQLLIRLIFYTPTHTEPPKCFNIYILVSLTSFIFFLKIFRVYKQAQFLFLINRSCQNLRKISMKVKQRVQIQIKYITGSCRKENLDN